MTPRLAALALFAALAAAAPAAQAQDGYYNFEDSFKAEKTRPHATKEKTPASEDLAADAEADNAADSGENETAADSGGNGAPDDTPNMADTGDQAPAKAQSHIVTSVMKCYDEIGADEARKIRMNSLTPYADCQKKLRQLDAEDEKARADRRKAKDTPETPQNFIRVREKAAPEDKALKDKGLKDKEPLIKTDNIQHTLN